MKERWIEWGDKYLELTPREKVIIAAASVFLVTYLAFMLLVEPVIADSKKVKAKLESEAGQLALLNNQIAEVKAALKKDPNEALKLQIKELRANITELDKKIDQATEDYVAPEQMTKELTSLLSTSSSVKVIGVPTLVPEVIKVDMEGDTNEANASFYRHQFVVTLEGEYFPLMHFVEKVVAKNKEFAVNNLDYQVTEYPEAHMTLTLVTISDSKNVIRL